MNNKFKSVLLVIILLLIICITPAFGRSMITGKVVEAVTGEPIEGAAVYIYWSKMGEGPPGLAGYVDVEVAETLTDTKGSFSVPKYSTWFNDFTMTIYKKGYVCWNNEKIFPTWADRTHFKLKNGMVIQLELFKEAYSKEDHARFTIFESIRRKGRGLFSNSIEDEIKLRQKMIRKREE